MAKEGNKRFQNLFFQLMIIALLLGIIPLIIGFGFSGFDKEEIFNLYVLYVAVGSVSMLVLFFAIQYEKLVTKGDNKYGNSILFASPGETPSAKIFRYFENKRLGLLMLSLLVFSIIGLFLGSQGQTFTGEVLVTQQFGPTGDLLFRLFLVPLAENLTLAGVIGTTLVIVRLIARKNNWGAGFFRLVAWISVIFASTIVWLMNHILRYGSSDISRFSVGFFGLAQGLLTLATGSFVPAVALHATNNLFFDLQKSFSSDTTLVVTILVIGVLAVLTFFTIRGKKKK